MVVSRADSGEVTCTFPGERTDKVDGPIVLHRNNRCTLTFTKNARFSVRPDPVEPKRPGESAWEDHFYTELRIWRCRKDPHSRLAWSVSAAGLGDTIVLK